MKKGRAYKSLYLPALIIVATVLTLLVVIAVSTYRNINRDRQRAEDSLLREGLAIIRAVEAGLRVDSFPHSPDLPRLQRIVEEVSREPSILGILLFSDQGEVMASTPGARGLRSVPEAHSLALLVKEKGMVTRDFRDSQERRVFEVIKAFRPLPGPIPLPWVREEEKGGRPQMESLQGWAEDKLIAVQLSLGAMETAREQDIHHALLMAGILVVLGTGAIYFIRIVQNYYLVDRSLAQMKTYTENVVESMADALISIDRERRIVTVNRRAGEVLGVPEKGLKGKAIAEVLGQEVEGLLRWEDGRPVLRNQEIGVPHPSGREIPLSLSAAPLRDETGRGMGSVLLIRDLREIRELQEKVRRGERLASLGRLAAGVAHEIRNPLSSIRGFAQYFRNRFKDQKEELEYASIMVKEVDRLNRVITELLDFARPKEPHREPHSLEEILDHTLEVLRPELAKKKAEVEKRYESELPPARVDRDQLSQALLNLLINSLEAMEEGGKVRVGVRREGRDSLRVSISDTGKGIPGEDLEKVFEPFFSTKRKGTGLGLAIVHQIVESHGGHIQVESKEGEGTDFQIVLPIGRVNGMEAV